MDQKYGEFVGVDSLFTAPILVDNEEEFITGAPEYFAPVADIGGQPVINNKTTYYDNKAANNYTTEGKTELDIVVSNLPAQKMAVHLGKDYDAASGRVFDSGEPKPPYYALGFRYDMGNDGYRYFWYLKGTFSGGAEEATTKKEDIEVKNYSLKYTAVTTAHKWSIAGKLKSQKRVYADTYDEVFDPTGWFDQVQTPDTVGAPAPVALLSVAPADGAAAVSLDASIVLTFNNRIQSEKVILIDSSTGSVVSAAKSFDSACKVMTIMPLADLSESTKYIVAVAGVIDIYGQELAATSSDFTTES